MPAKDIYHDTVKNGLVKDGWTITHDPLRIRLVTFDPKEEAIIRWIP
jgi:hypothetical protein